MLVVLDVAVDDFVFDDDVNVLVVVESAAVVVVVEIHTDS